MTRPQRAFFQALLIALLLSWSPFKVAAYLAPLLALGWYLIRAPLTRRSAAALALLAGAWAAWICLHGLFNREFVVQNGLLAFVTLSSFYLPFVVDGRQLRSRELVLTVSRLLLWILAVEGAIGIVQAAYGYTVTGSFDIANGDFVEGTIHLPLAASGTFANPMFAANIGFAVLTVLPNLGIFGWPGRFAALLGTLALALASVVHLKFILLAAMIAASPLLLAGRGPMRKLRAAVAIGVTVTLVVATMSTLLRGNLESLGRYAEGGLYGDNQKVEFARRIAIDVLEKPSARHVLGFGPGQFASRSSLIGTGLYFGGPLNPTALPLLEPVQTPWVRDDLMDLWLETALLERPAGATLVPYSSWLATVTEVGLLGTALLGVALLALLGAIARKARSGDSVAVFCVTAGVLFLVGLGLPEHYWEVPQAIFPGCLALRLLAANLQTPPAAVAPPDLPAGSAV